WRKRHSPEELALFDRMRDVRIEDFHYGVLSATASYKWVDATERSRAFQVFSAQPDSMIEARNPDGSVVRGHTLTTVQTLSIPIGGTDVEATEVCRRFIALIEDLVTYVETSEPKGAP